MVRGAVWSSGAVLSLLVSAAAAAETASSADKAVAESLFQDGRKLMNKGDLAQACPKLAESNRLVPRLGTLLNLATCHEKQGKTASAWAEFTEAIALAKQAQRKEREKYAREHADALEKKLSRVVFELESPTAGALLRIDGEELGSAVWGTPLPVDPGTREIEVSAPGRKSWSKSIDVAAAANTITVRVPELEREQAEPNANKNASALPTDEQPKPKAPEADTGSSGSAQKTLGFVALGVGVVGLGVGSYFGLQTFSKQNESEDHCDGTLCDQEGVDLRKDAKTTATISTIGFAAGGAAIAAGIILILTAGDSRKPQRDARALWIAPGVGSIAIGGSL